MSKLAVYSWLDLQECLTEKRQLQKRFCIYIKNVWKKEYYFAD